MDNFKELPTFPPSSIIQIARERGVKNSLILQGTFLILSSYHNSCIKLKLEKVKVRNLIIFLTVPLEPKRVCISGKAGLQ